MSAPVQCLKLPGWRSTLDIAPLRHSIDLHDTIKLHGALHLCANVGHDLARAQCQKPLIVLIPREPTGEGWASNRWDAHWMTEAATSMDGRTLPVELLGAIRRITIGQFHEVAVSIPPQGTYSVVVESLTPMILKRADGSFAAHLSPGDWIGATHQSLRRFLGSSVSKIFASACFDLSGWRCRRVEVDTRWSGRPIAAFLWTCRASVDASGLLALRVLEQLGIGATVSRGFGRLSIC